MRKIFKHPTTEALILFLTYLMRTPSIQPNLITFPFLVSTSSSSFTLSSTFGNKKNEDGSRNSIAGNSAITFCKNTHTDEHPNDISDQDWQKKVPCQPLARPGLEVEAALVRSGRRQAEPGGTHLYEKNNFSFSIFNLLPRWWTLEDFSQVGRHTCARSTLTCLLLSSHLQHT